MNKAEDNILTTGKFENHSHIDSLIEDAIGTTILPDIELDEIWHITNEVYINVTGKE
jgi:hypothetical protein